LLPLLKCNQKRRNWRCIATWGCPSHHGQAWARGTICSPLWKCCEVFLCITSYSKTLSRRIIYALFSPPVVGF